MSEYHQLSIFHPEYIAALIAAVAAIVAYFQALRAKEHMEYQKRNWEAQNLIYLHQFLTEERYFDARRKLRYSIEHSEEYCPDKHDHSIDLVSSAYDQAGFILLESGFVNNDDKERLLLSSWGQSIIELYEEVRHFELERDPSDSKKFHNTQNFFYHFLELYSVTCELWNHDKTENW